MTFAQPSEIIKDFQSVNIPSQKDGVMELIQAYVKVLEENQRLKGEIDKLKSNQNLRNNLSFDGEVYFCEKDGKKEGPFCTGCFDIDNKMVRVHPREDENKTPIWLCKICDFEYQRA